MKLLAFTLLFALGFADGCVHTTPAPPGQQKESAEWSSDDVKTIGKELVEKLLQSPWLKDFSKSHGGALPAIQLAKLESRVDGHLDLAPLDLALKENLTKSSRFNLNSAPKGGKPDSKFSLAGHVSSSVHRIGSARVVTYKIDLALTSVANSEIVWSARRELKKKDRG